MTPEEWAVKTSAELEASMGGYVAIRYQRCRHYDPSSGTCKLENHTQRSDGPMSMLTGQCNRLRETASKLREHFGAVSHDPTLLDAVKQMEDAAETIESLRTDCQEWHRAAKSRQDSIDHMRDAQKENQKLRDLVQMMYACKGSECAECWWYNDGYACCHIMRDLGIEVE